MPDTDREWTIELAGDQLYDIISLLYYEETTVKIWGPTATDPTTVEQENGARLLGRQASELGRLSRQRAGV
ncbi:MAG: hypothetical protein WA317_08805 [Mycobacterium sp.]|uniref:hypothetical protein n=1 Tax=Mycobacterium sp. TaxID=1785 RepID=UPI003CC67A7A